MPAKTQHSSDPVEGYGPHFDVTCVIGRVWISESGEDSPYEAAFRLIGQHAANGEYHFDADDGGITVTVDGFGDRLRR